MNTGDPRGPDGSSRGPLSWLATAVAGLTLLYVIANGFFGKKRLPGPWFSLPLLGDTLELLRTDSGRLLFSRFKQYGRVFRMGLLGFEAVVVADPEALRPILADDGAHFDMPVVAFNWLMGWYPIQNKKETHGPWRKVTLAAMTGAGLKALVPPVARVMEERVAAWAREGRVEIFQEARLMGLDLSILAITGVDLAGKVDLNWFKEQMALFLGGLYCLPLPLPGTRLWRALAAK